MALVAWRLGDYAYSQQQFVHCLALRDAVGDQRLSAYNLRAYVRLLVTMGNLVEAERLISGSVLVSQAFPDRVFAGFADVTLGHLDVAAGRHVSARQRFTHSLAIARSTGNFQMQQEALLGLGATNLAMGQIVAAQQQYEESMTALRRLGIERSFCWATAFIGMGKATLLLNDQAQAEAYFAAALAAPGCSAWDADEATAKLAQMRA